jgi:hypothetical protein
MSYEIVYDKMFIKAEKDNKVVFFPMLYMGSNNCYQFDRSNRGRRERSWCNLTYILKGKRFGTLEEILANVEAERQRLIERNEAEKKECEAKNDMGWFTPYSDERWGYFTAVSFGGGCKSTFGQYKGLFTTGCRKALTVEELKEFGVNVNIHSYIYSDENKKKYEEAGRHQIDITPKTSKELIETLDMLEDYEKEFPYVSLYVSIDADEMDMKRIRREKFPKAKPEIVDTTNLPEFYVIKDVSTGNFIMKFTRRGYRYSHYGSSWCKRFSDKKKAERYATKACKRYNEEKRFIVETITKNVGATV